MQYKRKRAGLLKSALLGAATLGAISLAGAGVAQAGQITFKFGVLTQTSTGSNTTCTSGDCVLGSTATYTKSAGGTDYSLTASGYTNESSSSPTFKYSSGTPTATNVSQRFGSGGAEIGLGVASSGQTSGSPLEIDPGEFLALDVSQILNAKPPGSVNGITLGSIQSGEGGAVFTLNTLSTSALSNISSYLAGGTLDTGTTLLATLNSGTNGGSQSQFSLLSNVGDYLIITADNIRGTSVYSKGNVLVSDLTVNTPEPGSLALLGTGLLGLGLVARRRRRKAA